MRNVSTLLAIVAAAVIAVGGCSPAQAPSAAATPFATPSASPPPSPTATAFATPSATPSPSPTPVASPTADELYLLSGVRLNARVGCVPVREGLPAGATAAVECVPNGAVVDRFGVTLFASTDVVVAFYIAEMAAHGVALNSGGCSDGQGESPYFPGPDDVSFPYRNGCFVAAVAQFRAIDSGGHVLIAIAGKSPTVSKELDAYAWEGNQDTPGAPTLWRAP